MEILQRFQNKYLRIIINASWYVINGILHHNFNIHYEIRISARDMLIDWKNILIYDYLSHDLSHEKYQSIRQIKKNIFSAQFP